MSLSPPIIRSERGESEALLEAARFMLVAARTAPKTSGKDDILALILYGKEKDAVAENMIEIAVERGIQGFKRDAENVRDSHALILVGVRGDRSIGLDCGGCGYRDCKEFGSSEKKRGNDFKGPMCIFKALDLGISLGSAVKTAAMFDVDNRIMYRAGTAAMKMRLLPEATIVMGIPISAKGKNIYFDRKK